MAQPITWRNIGSSLRTDPLKAGQQAITGIKGALDDINTGITGLGDKQADQRAKDLTAMFRDRIGGDLDKLAPNEELLRNEAIYSDLAGGRVADSFDGSALASTLRTEIETPINRELAVLQAQAGDSSQGIAGQRAAVDALTNRLGELGNLSTIGEQQIAANTNKGEVINREDGRFILDETSKLEEQLRTGKISLSDLDKKARELGKSRDTLDENELGALNSGIDTFRKKYKNEMVQKDVAQFSQDVRDPTVWENSDMGREEFTKARLFNLQAKYNLTPEEMQAIAPQYGAEYDSATTLTGEQQRAYDTEKTYIQDAVIGPVEQRIADERAKLKTIAPKTYQQKYEENRETLFALANNSEMQERFVDAMSGGDASDFWRQLGQEFVGDDAQDMKMTFAVAALNSDIFGGKFWDDNEFDPDTVRKNIKLLSSNLKGEEKAYFDQLADLRVREQLLSNVKSNLTRDFETQAYRDMKDKGGSIKKFRAGVATLVNGFDDKYNKKLAVLRDKAKKDDPKPKPKVVTDDPAIAAPSPYGNGGTADVISGLTTQINALPRNFDKDPAAAKQAAQYVNMLKSYRARNTPANMSNPNAASNTKQIDSLVRQLTNKVSDVDAFKKMLADSKK